MSPLITSSPASKQLDSWKIKWFKLVLFLISNVCAAALHVLSLCKGGAQYPRVVCSKTAVTMTNSSGCTFNFTIKSRSNLKVRLRLNLCVLELCYSLSPSVKSNTRPFNSLATCKFFCRTVSMPVLYCKFDEILTGIWFGVKAPTHKTIRSRADTCQH